MQLGDLGATVIKVERRGVGDDTRSWGPPWFDESTSTYFHAVNRGKASIELNLSDADDQQTAHQIADRADIMVENFRPGTLEKYGLSWEQCAARNSKLIYCTIDGFGDTEQASHLPGYDLLVQAASGLMSITGEPDGRPLKTGVAIVDVLAALQATTGVLAAVHHRTTTGRGSRIQVSLMDSALAALINQTSGYVGAGVDPHRAGNDHPSIAPYSTYQAADREFVIACGNDTQFAKLCTTLDIPALATDARYARNADRVAHRTELDAALHQQLRRQPAARWIDLLTVAGVPAGPINTVAEAIEQSARLGLQPLSTVTDPDGHQSQTIRSPLRFTPAALDGEQARPNLTALDTTSRSMPPRLGQHDEVIRAWLADESRTIER